MLCFFMHGNKNRFVSTQSFHLWSSYTLVISVCRVQSVYVRTMSSDRCELGVRTFFILDNDLPIKRF